MIKDANYLVGKTALLQEVAVMTVYFTKSQQKRCTMNSRM